MPRENVLILQDNGFRALGAPNQKSRNAMFYDDCERINEHAILENKSFEWRENMHLQMIDKWRFKKLTTLQRLLP